VGQPRIAESTLSEGRVLERRAAQEDVAKVLSLIVDPAKSAWSRSAARKLGAAEAGLGTVRVRADAAIIVPFSRSAAGQERAAQRRAVEVDAVQSGVLELGAGEIGSRIGTGAAGLRRPGQRGLASAPRREVAEVVAVGHRSSGPSSRPEQSRLPTRPRPGPGCRVSTVT